MKKLMLFLALGAFMVSANAQIATENSKLFDNWSVGAQVGVMSPLDMNSVFPMNTTIGVNVKKDLTPIIGVQAEYMAVLNDNHFGNIKTGVNATNLGLNGVINWSNLAFGYKGSPRLFELSTVTGLGWLHKYDASCNHLTAKTGLELSWGFGKDKIHSITLNPSVYWNLNASHSNIGFNKHAAQLSLAVGYVYRFKTSNGTHNFKIHDIGQMQSDIEALQDEVTVTNSKNERLSHKLHATREALKKCKEDASKVKEVVVEKEVTTLTTTEWVIQFPQGGSTLTKEAKEILNAIPTNVTVDVVGTASPEGNVYHNKILSEKRAAVVTDYLRNKVGVTVRNTSGEGVREGESTNRLAIVTVVTE